MKRRARFPHPIGPDVFFSLLLHSSSTGLESELPRQYPRHKHLPSLISERGFGNAIPLKISDAGLGDIANGLDVLRSGKVSGSKLAYKL